MDKKLDLDYYYGIEAEQFSFYRVPRILIKDERFKCLSSDAKLLYGLMLDRLSMSMKNGWFDEENRAYIVYALDNVMEDLGCSKPTCIKIIRELDAENGIGLIERKRRGLGKPDIIYVKNFATLEAEEKPESEPGDTASTDVSTEVKNFNFKREKNFTSESKEDEPPEVKDFDFKEKREFTSESKSAEIPEVKKFDFKREKNFTSGGKETELQEVKNPAPNYNNNNYNNNSYNNPINQSENSDGDRMDEMDSANAYMEIIKENIEYEHHMKYAQYSEKDLYQELYDVICEIVCVKHKTVRIGGDEYPYELVKSKFLKLNSSHLDYVISCMRNTTTKINNIKAYMVTALYNAPSTISHYYQQEVQHDMYGGGWSEKGIV